jgi:hypothetical protein
MYTRFAELMIKFCEALVAHQVNSEDSWDGGIICPYCKCIHGRMGDSIFPLYFAYLQTRQEKFLTAARKVVAYTERTQLPDGAWTSQEMGTWKGTTVFKLLSMIHAYDVLNRAGMTEDASHLISMINDASRWTSMVFGQESIENNVNYFVTSATALEWASRILNIPEYARQGRKLIAKYGLGSLNRDGFLLGETTHKSITPVDIGYNLDMSLGVMAEYAILTGDEDVKEETIRALKTHVQFVYPDGSIDNSFGSRSYKWTLFGSKTAAGSQVALSLLCDADPVFARAAELNARYLESLCSPDYIIGYGPDYWDYYRSGCIHSTFNRADALAISLAYGKRPSEIAEKIPSEEIFGVRHYTSLNVTHVRMEHLMATVSAFATQNSPSGGSLTYLWSDQVGPVQVGCVTEYDRSDEPQNIPEYPIPYSGPTTPRIEVLRGGKKYSNLYEYDARMVTREFDHRQIVTVYGKFREKEQKAMEDSGLWYSITYTFGENWVEKIYQFDLQHDCEKISVIEPVVCSSTSRFSLSEKGLNVFPLHGEFEVLSEPEGFTFQKDISTERILSVFPSVACLPLTWQREHVRAGVYEKKIRINILPGGSK